jgi:putative heme-binding domain-containing protein
LQEDTDPEVRAEAIRGLGAMLGAVQPASFPVTPAGTQDVLSVLLSFGKASLAAPTAPSTRNGKPQKVHEAYDREFERYLVRMFLEQHPKALSELLATDAGKKLPVEARLLASLSLEPKTSAPRVAELLPQLNRPPNEEEILRLMQALELPEVGAALKTMLTDAKLREPVAKFILSLRTRVDAAKLTPILTEATKTLLAGDAQQADLGIQLAGGFKLKALEPQLVALLEQGLKQGGSSLTTLRALADLGSTNTALFARLAESASDALVRDEALAALAASKAPDAAERTLALYAKLSAVQRRTVLEKLSTTKPGAATVVAAIKAGTIAKTDVDAATLDRLLAVLGDKDPAHQQLVESLGTLFRPVLALDGSDSASVDTDLVLEGPLTVEAWVKLAPNIGNADGIFCAPGKLDLNFFAGSFRVWDGPGVSDVAVSKKKTVPEMWTHVAATRDAAGIWKLYTDGELDAVGTKAVPQKLENPKIAWTNGTGGTHGQIAELRVWNRERTGQEIRANFDRGLPEGTTGLVFNPSAKGWGKLNAGASVVKTSDLPPVLSAEAAAKLDADFAKYRALAEKKGDAAKGKLAAAMCTACHLIGTQGGQIGPNLSGVGAMGNEAILRNILTPNAAMESAYRIYRVEQKDGTVLDAFYVSEDKDAVVIRLPGAADQRLPKASIRKTTFLRRSLMPEGLLEGMSPEQVTDLFTYLGTLK